MRSAARSSIARTAFRAALILLGTALLFAGHLSAWAAPARPSRVARPAPRHSVTSPVVRLSSAITPPAAPSGLALYTNPTPTSIELYWTSNSTNESSFSVERKVDGQPDTAFTPVGSADAVDSVGARVNFTDPSALAFDTVYDYRVRAIAADGTPLRLFEHYHRHDGPGQPDFEYGDFGGRF